jgi:TPR repeat protein
MRKLLFIQFIALAGLLAPPAVRADLYQAEAAVNTGDLPKAFTLFRELAELGHGLSQENLAVMYVGGEGVARDNVLGYAWAKLALEQGSGGDSARSIVAQIEPRLTDAAKGRVAEIRAQYGDDALRARLLPAKPVPLAERAGGPSTPDPGASPCRMKAAANPDSYFPFEAKEKSVSGEVLIEARVAADGSVRQPRAMYSVPVDIFEEAGRAVALNSKYTAARENGVAVPCVIRFKVKFSLNDHMKTAPAASVLSTVDDLRARATKGDPMSQLLYGMDSFMRSEFRAASDGDTWWFMKAAQAGLPTAQYLVGMQLAANGNDADHPKGIRWLEMGAKGGSGSAMTVLAGYLLAAGQSPESRNQGFEWLQRAATTTHREGKFLFAALLVSWPDTTRRDPARALALIDEVGDAFDYDPLISEIRAAAFAAQGDFKKAARAQSKAVGIASRLDWDVAAHRARLQAYESGRMPELDLVRF